MNLSFPASRSCLWDERPTGEAINIHITSSGWIQLKINSNVVNMAIQHSSRQSCDTEAWLMATPAITKSNSIVIEINRFDPGKWVKNGNCIKLHPTIVLPGDIAIHCKVTDRTGSGCGNEGVMTHNLSTLQDVFSLLDQRIRGESMFSYHHAMSLRVIIIKGDHHRITLKSGCVLPSGLGRLHPVQSVPLLPVALARNLTSPNPLSSLQSIIRMGYLTMDKCRKLVPLLPSDGCVFTLPLVGVWISGAGCIDHPTVWSVCLHYFNTTASIDRVYGSDSSCLVLLPGREGSQLWQCSLVKEGWEWHLGEANLQLAGMGGSLEMMPVVEGTAASTLLQSSLDQWREGRDDFHPNDSLPLLSPAPRPVSVPSFVSHDSDLSCLSELNISVNEVGVASDAHKEKASVSNMDTPTKVPSDTPNNNPSGHTVPTLSSEVLLEHQKQLEALQEQVKLLLNDRSSCSPKEVNVQTTPTNNASTNTGRSLLEGLPLNYDSCTPNNESGSSKTISLVSNSSQLSSSSGTLTPPLSPPTASSIASTSIFSRNLTSLDYSCSIERECEEETDKPVDQQFIYNRLKSQIDDLLGASCHASQGDNTSGCSSVLSDISNCGQQSEHASSFIDVPRIRFTANDFTQISDTTFDSRSINLADVITQRYTHDPPSDENTTRTVMEYSTATHEYLSKHGLCDSRPARILDIDRLRNIPKLI